MPEVSYAHPLQDRPAGIAWRDVDRTVADLPRSEGHQWRHVVGPLVRYQHEIVELALSDKRSIPPALRSARGLAGAAHFARVLLGQGTRWWDRQLPGVTAGALLAGVGAHAIMPMPSLTAAGAAALLAAVGHTSGWGLPVGGSQAITDALHADLRAHGGEVLTDHPITTWRELPRARTYLFDTSPRALAQIWGEKLPARAARALHRFPYGTGAAKVDFVISEPVPWQDERLGSTGTVHLGGDRAEMARAERAVADGKHAEDPFVLVSEPAQVVASRQVGELRPLWAYAHVPAGSQRDMTEAIAGKIERFAPGFRDVVVASRALSAQDMAAHNANYIGGDISTGAVNFSRMIARPTLSPNPYATAIPGVYLSSSATPPGPAVHGMNGWFAAIRALKARFGGTAPPSLRPR